MLKCLRIQAKRNFLRQPQRTYAAGWKSLYWGGGDKSNNFPSSTLLKPPSIRIRKARLRDVPNLVRFLRNSFSSSEPLVSALRMPVGRYSPALEELWRNYIDYGMSFMAVPSKFGSSEIFGAIINTKICSWDPEQMMKFSTCILCPKTKDLINLWAYFFTDSAIFSRYDNAPLFNIMHVIVDENQCKRFHTGLTASTLATHLINKSLRFASVKRFHTACLVCTSQFLSDVAKNMGMDLLWQYPYNQFLNENMEPLLKVENSETEVNMFIKELSELQNGKEKSDNNENKKS